MEAYILLLLFFLGLPIAIYLVLTDPDKSAVTLERQHTQNAQRKNLPGASATNLAAYTMLGAIFVFMCVLTVLTRRGHA